MTNTTPESLRDILKNFVDAPTWEASRQIVAQHQAAILTDSAEACFTAWLAEEIAANNISRVQTLTWYREVLRRCKSEGVETTFDHLPEPRPVNKALQAFLGTTESAWLHGVLQNLPEILSETATEEIQKLIVQIQATDQEAAMRFIARFNVIKIAKVANRPIPEELGQLLKGEMNPQKQRQMFHNLGEIYYQNGEIEQALNYFKHELTLSEQVGDSISVINILDKLGTIYRQQGAFEQVLTCYEQILTSLEQGGDDASIADYLNKIGGVYTQQGQTEKALNNFEQSSALYMKSGLFCCSQGKLAQGMNYFKRTLSLREKVGKPDDIIQTLDLIGSIYLLGEDLEAGLPYYERALVIREQIGSTEDIVQALGHIANVYKRQGKLRQALAYYERTLALREQLDDPAALADTLYNIGMVCRQRGEYEKALAYYERALALGEQLDDPVALASTLNNMGTAYSCQGQLEKALSFYQRAQVLREKLGDPDEIASSLNNIGSIYHLREEYEQALSYYERALALFEQVDDTVSIARSLNNIGMVYFQQGNLTLSQSYLERALELKEQVDSPIMIGEILHNLSFVYNEQGAWELAIEKCNQALSIHEILEHGFEQKVVSELEMLAHCYTQLGEDEKSETYRIRAQQLHEKLPKSS